MAYPHLSSHPDKDELAEHFSLYSEDLALLGGLRKDEHQLGCAVLLKTLLFLGHPPHRRSDVPEAFVEHLARQLDLSPALFQKGHWKDRRWKRYLRLVRQHTGFRPMTVADHVPVVEWLQGHVNEFPTRKSLFDAAISWCRSQHLELPAESELRRLVGSAWRQFFSHLYERVSGRIDQDTQKRMDRMLEPEATHEAETATVGQIGVRYDWLKQLPGKMGMKTLLEEVRKLRAIDRFKIKAAQDFAGINPRLVQRLRDRAKVEDASQMRRHRPARRHTLLAALLHHRGMEVTDGIVRAFLEHIRRIEKKTDMALEKVLLDDVPRIYGKQRILYRIAKVAMTEPDATFRAVLFPEVSEATLERLIEEFEREETSGAVSRPQVMRKKYSTSYRRMLKPVLDALTFRTNSLAYQPLIDALQLVRRYLNTRHVAYPAGTEIPEGLLTGDWADQVWVKTKSGLRAIKQYVELCVLQKLERAIKCKEVWVEGSYRYRNPDEDMPTNWAETREEHYRKRGLPLDVDAFLAPLQREMTTGLTSFNRFMSGTPDVTISHPGGGDRGVFNVPKLERQPERPLIQEAKDAVQRTWGMLDLLDILVEADRRVNFLRFFHTSAQRQVLTPEALRERMLLTIFSMGTNVGLKRIHSAANPTCTYADLRYFRSRFLHADSLREATAALVNCILKERDPAIWGHGSACASDGKQLGAWDQNLMAEWNPHYQRRGVMVYWHVETNATCIYSQLKTVSSSEVAAMVEGLVRHDTEMRVEKNYVDSHGQSEVAFAFCRLLRFELLPRLKRIKHQRLYLPDKGLTAEFPHLAGVLERPIRWDLIREQYDEIIRHVVAVAEGTGPTDSILRRFSSYNRNHPTYRACIELGKALKTIFLCRYLSNPALRQEVHAGLNVVENWNGTVDFVHYGRKSEFNSNDPELQELSVLCLHLLQNAIILSHTIMLERVLQQDGLLSRMVPEDLRALTPLFTSDINPYGDFDLDLVKPSFLDKEMAA